MILVTPFSFACPDRQCYAQGLVKLPWQWPHFAAAMVGPYHVQGCENGALLLGSDRWRNGSGGELSPARTPHARAHSQLAEFIERKNFTNGLSVGQLVINDNRIFLPFYAESVRFDPV